MKSRSQISPLKPSEQEIFAEADLPDDLHESGKRLPKPVRAPSSGFDATFLLLAGVASFCGGMLLSLGPKISWKVDQISEGFKHLGVQGGVLVMGGLILCAIGLLRRGQIALRAPTAEQAEDRLLIEQLTKDSLRVAEDLARLESGLAHVESELARSRRTLEEKLAGLPQDVVAAMPAPKEPASPEEAIFRLAASLDQVGARIEQRLKAQYTALQDHLEDVGAAILSARNHMQDLKHSGTDGAAALREEVQAQVESALEETGFWSAARRAAERPSLGVLDMIEDGTPEDRALHALSAPLPQPCEERQQPATHTLDFAVDAVDTKTRLIQLSSLLADPKLREALEGLAKSEE